MLSDAVAAERGATLVIFALWLPVLVLVATFVLDVGNWFEHKRHLQMQADAAALAAGDQFNSCFGAGSTPVSNAARQYGGDPSFTGGTLYNQQIGGVNRGTVSLLVNSKTYPDPRSGDPGPDDTNAALPCTAGMADVKLTESNLPLLFGIFRSACGLFVCRIHAHSRVQLFTETTRVGSLPVAVPDPGYPVTAASVEFINEDTGASLGTARLTSAGGGAFKNSAAPVSVNMAAAAHVGAVIKLTGATPAPTTLTCGQAFVQCYDLSSPLNAAGSPTRGAIFVRGYPTAGYSTASGEPAVKSVTLVSPAGGCNNAYFFTLSSGSCKLGVSADVTFADATGNNRSVSATLSDYTTPTPDYTETNKLNNSSGSTWVSDGSGQGPYFSVPAQEGAVKVTLSWTKKAGSYSGRSCTASNPCAGNWNGFVFQRTMSGGDPYSGPIATARLCEGTGGTCSAANSYVNDGTTAATTHSLWLDMQLQPSLGYATSVSSPPVYLRVEGNQGQTIDCDPALPNLRQELDFGCAPQYTVNKVVSGSGFSIDCSTWPTSNNNWKAPNYGQPWPCVSVQTGGAAGQVSSGIEDRMTRVASTICPPNNWSSYPSFSPSDPRLVGVVLTPFGSFGGSGSANFPVTGFAEFYITGWAKSGTGNKHPQPDCSGDDTPPGADYVVGRFVHYVDTINVGGGGDVCDSTKFGNCVPVLTK